ncbi:thioredoxin family protein [Haliangium ochraceum]|uniref:Alkyl hydroperoxide reductase/ Thiol specific antioxidant/ Mal allergen n=1 Tax=Haliangium ochraceum (strain DSM 14365 / JCM 11303 / SMP-2) TaxID=502025 RepID=D0LW94_HALO1|nr:thioredoxin family protein [Haliangium ochraceum]ACY16026.1 alkyl hydroperoxide reductase/ Thiol specific antioxidant/ Mal allergen [Haliangium ochraceum DSM 14365]
MFGSRSHTSLVRALLLATALILGSAGLASADAVLGQPAPAFELKDVDGKTVKLSDFRGKTVVIEWFNPGCPFIKYAHGEGPLKDPAKRPGGDRADVVWLAINSSASGKQGHGVALNKRAKAEWKIPYPVLIDESGTVGRAYGAKTTPHMYIVDVKGKLVYHGGLDNAPLGRGKGKTENFVASALADLAAGRSVQNAETKPYGCSVKY